MAETAQNDGNKYQVAFALMQKIASFEDTPPTGQDREYYLRLYRQCIKTVATGFTMDDILKEKRLGASS